MGLSPDAFWRMSLDEWRAAVAGRFGARASVPPITRAAMTKLMEQFPDG